MLYRKRPTSFVGRLTSLKEANQQLDSEGKSLVRLSDELVDEVRAELAWYEPRFHQRHDAAKAVLRHLSRRRKAYRVMRRFLYHVLQNFQFYVEDGWAEPDERRTYFNLNPENNDLGIPSADKEVVVYVEMVLKEEKKRCQDGCKPLPDMYVEALEEAWKNYEAIMVEVRNERNAYFRVKRELLEHLPVLDSVINRLWKNIDADLSNLPHSTRRQIAMQYGVRYFLRRGADAPLEEPTQEDLQQVGTNPANEDPMLETDVLPGQDPEDDLGVERALHEAGLLDDIDQNAEGGAEPADE